MVRIRKVAMALLVMVMAGCGFSTIGQEFDPGKRSLIVNGKTTKGEILQMLGEPSGKSDIPGTGEVWSYHYARGKAFLFFAKGESSFMTVQFNDDGIVTGSSVSGSTVKTYP